MGVYINMEMPKNGSCIQIVIDDDGKVYPSVEKCILKMGSIAKAVPVLPHGRCVDADELFKEMERNGWLDNADRDKAEDLVLAAPTIIPAEES